MNSAKKRFSIGKKMYLFVILILMGNGGGFVRHMFRFMRKTVVSFVMLAVMWEWMTSCQKGIVI